MHFKITHHRILINNSILNFNRKILFNLNNLVNLHYNNNNFFTMEKIEIIYKKQKIIQSEIILKDNKV